MQKNPTDTASDLTELFFYGLQHQVYEVKVLEPDASGSRLPESLVHAIWKKQQFQKTVLETVSGQKIVILNAGVHNQDAGPDFIHTKIEIDGVLWRGDVEIHKISSDWFKHNHHKDPRYNSTILHATLFSDTATGALLRADGSQLPELVLSPLLDQPIRSLLYAHRTRSAESLPCSKSWPAQNSKAVTDWLAHLAGLRLERKKKRIEQAYLKHPDLESILHRLLFIGLGYAKNSDPMHALAVRLPLDAVRSLSSYQDVEALHFGVSGLLPARVDREAMDLETFEYIKDARARYEGLNRYLQITPLPEGSWRFFRLRPANFPTIRVAQAASFYRNDGILSENLFDSLAALVSSLDARSALNALGRRLQSFPSSYWNNHYQFKLASAARSPVTGKMRVQKLLLNALLPVLLVYADQQARPGLAQKILDLTRLIKAERDEVTAQFAGLGIDIANAQASQGLHELFQGFCKQGRCLECKIGKSIISNRGDSP